MLWLALSYLSPGVIALPQILLPARLVQGFALLAAASVVAATAAQLWLVIKTPSIVRKARVQQINLRPLPELIWTALPLVLVLAIGVLSLPLWRALFM